MRIGKIKADTIEPQPHVIPGVEETPKIDTIVETISTYNYNTRSTTERFNHVTILKNEPNMFKTGRDREKTHTQAQTNFLAWYPKNKQSQWNQKQTTLFTELQVKCQDTETRNLVKLDSQVCIISMFNELGLLSQGWKKNAGTDTIEFIFHKSKQKYIQTTYVRAVCNMRPHKIETRRTRPTTSINLIDYPGEVRKPASNLITMKLHVNSVISEVRSRYMCMDMLTLKTRWMGQNIL